MALVAASNFPAGSDSPSSIDDTQRAHASFIALLRDSKADQGAIQAQSYTAVTTAGTSTAYTITPSPAITAYAIGQSFFVNFSLASGTTPTIAINGIAIPPQLVKQNSDATYSNIAAGDIPINHRSRVTLISATQALVERLRLSQTRSNVLVSRATLTSYTNTLPEPIMVYVSGTSSSANDQLSVLVGGQTVFGSVAPRAATDLSCVAFRVLPTESYRIAGNIAAITLFSWSEER